MNDNEKIAKWLGVPCWHPHVEGRGTFWCGQCKSSHNGNPDYTTWEGFGELLEGVKAKLYAYNSDETDYLQFIDCCAQGWRVDYIFSHHDGDACEFFVSAPDIRQALIEAVLMIIEREK